MPITWEKETDRIIVARVNGKLANSDIQEFQTALAPVFQVQDNIRFLVVLVDFEGWEASEEWGDLSFMDVSDQHIERFAIVGDEKWRDQTLMFMLAGLRPMEIKYFSLDQTEAARMWLNER